MKKHIFFLLVACLFISCKMEEKNMVSISGSINLDEKINLPKNTSARSAFPDLPAAVYYKIEAVKDGGGIPVLGEVHNDLSFSIIVEEGFKGKITVTGYKNYDGTDYSNPLLKGETQITTEIENIDNITITVSTINDAEIGNGTVNLPIYVDADGITISVTFNNKTYTAYIPSKTIVYFPKDFSPNVNSFAPGSYIANITIKNSSNSLFACTESINVSSNMETSTWVNSADSGQSIDYFKEMNIVEKQQTVLYISNELIDKYKYSNNIFYVKENTNAGKDGSFLYPFSTPQEAMNKIKDLNSALETPGSVQYTIIIDGEIKNTTETTMLTIEDTAEGGADPKPISVRIMGITSDTAEKTVEGDEYKIPTCTLNANEKSRVIYIGKNATVTIGPGVTITGGNSVYGSGVLVQGELILDGGVIYNNKATGYAGDQVGGLGAGILLYGGNCTIKSGKIIKNTAEKNSSYSSYGGGVCCYNNASTLRITGPTEIAYNTADNGGGIYNYGIVELGSENGTEQIITVKNNKANNSGGGIYLDNNNPSNLVPENKIYQVNFSENEAAVDGGGIYNQGSYLTIGNSEFTSCKVSANKAGRGGGICNLDIENFTPVKIIINGCSFMNCSVEENADLSSILESDFYGLLAYGGGCCIGTSFEMKNATFENCTTKADCQSCGGGLYLGNDATLDSITITDCSCTLQNIEIPNNYTQIKLGDGINQVNGNSYFILSSNSKIESSIYLSGILTVENFGNLSENPIKLVLPELAYKPSFTTQILKTTDANAGALSAYKDMFELNNPDYCINDEGKIEKKKTVYKSWSVLCAAVEGTSVEEGQVFYITGTLKADKTLKSTKPIKIHGIGNCTINRSFITGPIFEGNIIELKGESESSKITIDGYESEKTFEDGVSLSEYYNQETKYVNYENLINDSKIDSYTSASSCFVLSDGTNAIETVTIENVIFKNYAAKDCTFIFQASSSTKVSKLNIYNCEFENNFSYLYNPNGAVLGIDNKDYKCYIQECTFKNNKAISTDASQTAHGGAIAITKGDVTVNSVTAQANKSKNSTGNEVDDDIYIYGNNSKLKFYNHNYIDCLYYQGSSTLLPELTADNSIASQSKSSRINFYIDIKDIKDISDKILLLTINSIIGSDQYYKDAFSGTVKDGKNNPVFKFENDMYANLYIYINY